jgi:hypothetical protein
VSASPQPIVCDGCGVAASPEHLRERFARLELATRFRPIHIGVLFLIPAPDAGLDFYDSLRRTAGARELLLDALEIPNPPQTSGESNANESRLIEFQRRGFYFASVSECPLPADATASTLTHLAPTLLKRIQFSYKPKSVVLLSESLAPLVPLLAGAGRGIRILPDGAAIAWPPTGDPPRDAVFRAACARIADAART